MLEQLYRLIPERRLVETYKYIQRGIPVVGTPPSNYTGRLFTFDSGNPNTYDFTDSFLAYLNHNKNLLSCKVTIVNQPSFLIYYMEQSNNPNELILKDKAQTVKMYKLPLSATETFILSCDLSGITKFYDRIMTEINVMIRQRGFDNQLYFYKLCGVNNPLTGILTFMWRGAIDRKTIGS